MLSRRLLQKVSSHGAFRMQSLRSSVRNFGSNAPDAPQQLTTDAMRTYGFHNRPKDIDWSMLRVVGAAMGFLYVFDFYLNDFEPDQSVDQREFEYRKAMKTWMKLQTSIFGAEEAAKLTAGVNPTAPLVRFTKPKIASAPAAAAVTPADDKEMPSVRKGVAHLASLISTFNLSVRKGVANLASLIPTFNLFPDTTPARIAEYENIIRDEAIELAKFEHEMEVALNTMQQLQREHEAELRATASAKANEELKVKLSGLLLSFQQAEAAAKADELKTKMSALLASLQQVVVSDDERRKKEAVTFKAARAAAAVAEAAQIAEAAQKTS